MDFDWIRRPTPHSRISETDVARGRSGVEASGSSVLSHRRDVTDSAGYRECRRGDLVLRRGLGTVGQVGRSRNAQTADKRASGDYVTLGGRKSALLLLSLLPSTHRHHRFNLPLSPSPPHPSSPPCTFTNDRLLTSKPRTVYKQILPPFQTPTFTIVISQPGPGSTWSKVRSTEAWRQCRQCAAGGAHRDCIAQNCREPESAGPKKTAPVWTRL